MVDKILRVGSAFTFSRETFIVPDAWISACRGAFIGAQVGSKLAIRAGAKLIRPLLMVVCCAIAFKLMLDPAHPVYRWVAGRT